MDESLVQAAVKSTYKNSELQSSSPSSVFFSQKLDNFTGCFIPFYLCIGNDLHKFIMTFLHCITSSLTENIKTFISNDKNKQSLKTQSYT